MTTISVYSENQFYILGINHLVKELNNPHDNNSEDHINATQHQKKNIIFHEELVVISPIENKIGNPRATVFIIYCTKKLFLDEIKVSISHIMRMSKQSMKDNYHLNKIKEVLPSELDQLTFHEMEIIKLLAKGKSISTIAEIMNCKKSTIYAHRRNILRKTKTENRQKLNKIIQVLKNYNTQNSNIILL
ncbi:helix-turn-helix transcriptional regulator [Rosenbergiella epipactidis]|uniref:helix-turn-helix transcriptional regulator n=1 Tax=Rosenbergiella epipactidis TaxID=1544694 RepID=UPI001F4F9A88|nr:helix-turn-helix transcriptional regulator [Rosenbergiella epipactidis]